MRVTKVYANIFNRQTPLLMCVIFNTSGLQFPLLYTQIVSAFQIRRGSVRIGRRLCQVAYKCPRWYNILTVVSNVRNKKILERLYEPHYQYRIGSVWIPLREVKLTAKYCYQAILLRYK